MMIPSRNPKAAARVVDGEAVLVSSENGMLHSLNDVGTFIWSRMDGRTDLAAIATSLMAEYDVDRETAYADVESFCQALVEKKLVLLSENNG